MNPKNLLITGCALLIVPMVFAIIVSSMVASNNLRYFELALFIFVWPVALVLVASALLQVLTSKVRPKRAAAGRRKTK